VKCEKKLCFPCVYKNAAAARKRLLLCAALRGAAAEALLVADIKSPTWANTVPMHSSSSSNGGGGDHLTSTAGAALALTHQSAEN
jgi:hypothetical protein